MALTQLWHGLIKIAKPLVLYPLLAGVGLIILWATTIQIIRNENADAQHAMEVAGRAMAETYEAQVIRAVHEIDQSLKFVKFAYEQQHHPAVLQEMKQQGLLPLDLVFVISIVDDQGNTIASTDNAAPGARVDHYLFQSLMDKQNVAIGQPVKNIDTGEWKLIFGRRLSSPDGKFSGIVMAKVDASYFVSDYEPSKLGEHGLIGVLNADNLFLVRRSGEVINAGDNEHYVGIVPQQSVDDPESKMMADRWDGVIRYTTARRMFDFSLAVVVGLSVDERLVIPRNNIRLFLWRATGISVLMLLIFALLIRMSQQLEASRERAAEDQREHARRIEHLAYHDTLTNIPNRSLFSKLVAQSLSHAHRYNRQLAVLFIDLDRFKHINDTLGHDAGDQLLKEVATRLRGCLRESDTVARLGGDEFIVLLPELEEDRYVSTVAQKLITAIAEPYVLLGQTCSVTASIGISISPQDGEDEQTLTKNADVAMYRAKQKGKNNFQLFSAGGD